MKFFKALIITMAIISSGCSSLNVVRIRNEATYIRTPIGSTVRLEGIVQRFEDSHDTAMLVLKNGDRMPLGGAKIVSLMDGEYVQITGTMKAKKMHILNNSQNSSGGMSLTLKYVEVSRYLAEKK